MTWFHWDNYGTCLQACAMSKVIEKEGHMPEFVNYIPSNYSVSLYKSFKN